MKTSVPVALALVVSSTLMTTARGDGYPEATPDEATYDTICNLKIDRLQRLDEGGLQAEYRWALDMAQLCLGGPDSIRDQPQWWTYAIEFQRHAGRIARYRGLGEQALEDYDTAIEYAYQAAGLFPQEAAAPEDWEHNILQDIADTYLIMGAHEDAANVSNLLIERECLRGQGSQPTQLDRLAQIAEREARFVDAADLQRQRVQKENHFHVGTYVERHPELADIDSSLSWSVLVRHPEVRRALENPNQSDFCQTTPLRQAYYGLARALRMNRQLDEAAEALETAELTPWVSIGPYRERQDLYVDREWAWLALDRKKPREALERAEACLAKYVMSHAEQVELLDLVSRALEELGELQAAFEKLQQAIAIVETKRANLFEDEHKQLFIASYASLYRRTLDLVIRIHKGKGAEGTEESFQWSERVKARAMLDTLGRYGRQMARAAATGDARAMQNVRDLTGEVVSVEKLRSASWLPTEAALLEYTYGNGARPEAKAGAPAPVYLWVITRNGGSFRRLEVRADQVEKHCAALADALGQHDRRDESWVEPASWLYRHAIAPVAAELQGIKRLIIVGDGKLCTVPFETFVVARDARPERDGVKHRLLIEDYAVSYAPSATLLDRISARARPTSWDCTFWAAASTRFRDEARPPDGTQGPPPKPYQVVMRATRSLSLEDLPGAEREVKEAARHFDSDAVRLFLNKPDMKARLLNAGKDGSLPSARFRHFATHAVNDPQRPYLSGLVLCPPYPMAVERPSAAQDPTRGDTEKETDERQTTQKSIDSTKPWKRSVGRPELLTVGELAKLNLRSELVVLSACRSLGDMPIEGDWLYGLARAFLVAGSSGVVCTTCDTPDRAAMAVIPGLYRELAIQAATPGTSIDVPKALQQIKQSRLRSPMYGHPALWAPWVYHGRLAAD